MPKPCNHDFRPFNDRAIYCYRCGEFRESPQFARGPFYPQPVYIPPMWVPPAYPTWYPYTEPFWYTSVSSGTVSSSIDVGSVSYDANAQSTPTVQ